MIFPIPLQVCCLQILAGVKECAALIPTPKAKAVRYIVTGLGRNMKLVNPDAKIRAPITMRERARYNLPNHVS